MKILYLNDIAIRRGIFETASSSMHTVVMLPEKENERWQDVNLGPAGGTITLTGGSFGCEPMLVTDPEDKIDWLATYFIYRVASKVRSGALPIAADDCSFVIDESMLDEQDVRRYRDFCTGVRIRTLCELQIEVRFEDGEPVDVLLDPESDEKAQLVLDRGPDFIAEFISSPKWALACGMDPEEFGGKPIEGDYGIYVADD